MSFALDDKQSFLSACARGNLALVELFVKAGLCKHLFEPEPIKKAIQSKNYEVARYLIGKGGCVPPDIIKSNDIKNMYGDITQALETLDPEEGKALPLLLSFWFKEGDATPLGYLKLCPKWHRKYVANIIA